MSLVESPMRGPHVWGQEDTLELFAHIPERIHYSTEAGADPGFGQGGARTSEVKSCQCSKAESCERSKQSVARKQALEAFGFLMFKYAFSHILETLCL